MSDIIAITNSSGRSESPNNVSLDFHFCSGLFYCGLFHFPVSHGFHDEVYNFLGYFVYFQTLLVVFHWSLGDIKFPRVSRIQLNVLADLYSSQYGLFSFYAFQFQNPLQVFLEHSNCINYSCYHHIPFCYVAFQLSGKVLIFDHFSFSFSFTV